MPSFIPVFVWRAWSSSGGGTIDVLSVLGPATFVAVARPGAAAGPLAPENVRKTPADPIAEAELKASIAAHGVLDPDHPVPWIRPVCGSLAILVRDSDHLYYFPLQHLQGAFGTL